MSRFFALVACLLVASPQSSFAADLDLRLAPLAKDHKGKVAIAVKHLKTGEDYYLNADEALPTASLIKLPIMWRLTGKPRSKLKLDKTLTLRATTR